MFLPLDLRKSKMGEDEFETKAMLSLRGQI